MPYILTPRPRVEALGAVWIFGDVDEPMRGLVREAARLQAAGFDLSDLSASAPPAELLDPLVDLFREGVVAWEGVLDEEGNVIECTPEARAAVPLQDKLIVALAYLQRDNELQEKKGDSGAPPMNGTPPPAE